MVESASAVVEKFTFRCLGERQDSMMIRCILNFINVEDRIR